MDQWVNVLKQAQTGEDGDDESGSEPEWSDGEIEYEDMDCVDSKNKLGTIPYKWVYDTEEVIEKRVCFIPGRACIATIVNVERDTGGGVHLFNPYIYTIQLEHGPYKWTIYKRYREFHHLHNRLLLHRAAQKMKAPYRKLEHSLQYVADGDTGLTEVGGHANPAATNDSTPQTVHKINTVNAAPTPETNEINGQNEIEETGKDEVDASPRRKRKNMKLPRFPYFPDSIIGVDGIDARKKKLEQYLNRVLEIPPYKNHKETAEFLEVCRLSFVHNLGKKGREGLVKKRPGGRKAHAGCTTFCNENCSRWGKRWLLVKDSFLIYLDPDTMELACVLLFDSDFCVASGAQQTGGVRHGLLVSNLSRNLMLRCKTDKEAELWRTEIEAVAHGLGADWLKPHRFGSSFPIRDNVYAQWFCDGKTYMAHAASMMELAQEEIFITDWWLSPEIYMKRPIVEGERWRLNEILRRKAQQGVKVLILLYKEVEMALGINSLYSKKTLQALHPNVRVIRHPDHIPGTATNIMFWAHHEKILCIDQNIAFVGGVDLCYGRWDDDQHRLTDLGSVQLHTQESMNVTAGKSLMGGMRAMTKMIPTLNIQAQSIDEPIHEQGTGEMQEVAEELEIQAEKQQGHEENGETPNENGVPQKKEEGLTVTTRVVSMASPEDSTPSPSTDRPPPAAASAAAPAAHPTAKNKFKSWALKARSAQSQLPSRKHRKKDKDRSQSNIEGPGGTETAHVPRLLSMVEGGTLDFAEVVKRYKAAVDSGQIILEKRRGDTPPPTRKKGKFKKAIDNFKNVRRVREKPEDNELANEYDKIWRQLQEDDTDTDAVDGCGKLWIGKDYVNFIFKDVTNVDDPYQDFVNRGETCRMPWHDIHSVCYGSAARDVARHFIQRWNHAKIEKVKEDPTYPFLLPKSYDNVQVPRIFRQSAQKCKVQTLRSSCKWSAGIESVEDSIQCAYLHMIANAKHYIYIENQFFVSQINNQSYISNEICKTLCDRIVRAHENNETFRVYIVLPLMPAFEGQVGATGGSALQAVLHWTYLSISRGPNALLPNLKKRMDNPDKYLKFCALRSHGELCGKLITDILYIHSKLIIVDDRCALIGSANINDRSMLGKRDSEVALYFEDIEFDAQRMNGREYDSGKFCGSLRQYLMKEHLEILESQHTGGGSKLNASIDVTDPVCDEFWFHTWCKIAQNNTDIFEKVFNVIPTDKVLTLEALREHQAAVPMAEYNRTGAVELLRDVQGRLVAFPTEFLAEANLAPSFTTKEGLAPSSIFT